MVCIATNLGAEVQVFLIPSPTRIDLGSRVWEYQVDTNFELLRLRHQLGSGGFGRVQLVEEPDSSVAAWKALCHPE